MFLKLRGKFPKLKEKTQNSRKKLKLREDFTPPERPSGVIKKPAISCHRLRNTNLFIVFGLSLCKKDVAVSLNYATLQLVKQLPAEGSLVFAFDNP